MIEILYLTVIILLISVFLLCIGVFFSKRKRFPSTHVDANPALREKGIFCVKKQDLEDRKKKNTFESSK